MECGDSVFSERVELGGPCEVLFSDIPIPTEPGEIVRLSVEEVREITGGGEMSAENRDSIMTSRKAMRPLGRCSLCGLGRSLNEDDLCERCVEIEKLMSETLDKTSVVDLNILPTGPIYPYPCFNPDIHLLNLEDTWMGRYGIECYSINTQYISIQELPDPTGRPVILGNLGLQGATIITPHEYAFLVSRRSLDHSPNVNLLLRTIEKLIVLSAFGVSDGFLNNVSFSEGRPGRLIDDDVARVAMDGPVIDSELDAQFLNLSPGRKVVFIERVPWEARMSEESQNVCFYGRFGVGIV